MGFFDGAGSGLIGAATGGVLGSITGMAGYGQQKRLQSRQFDFQRKLNEQANRFNVQNYQMQRDDERWWNSESSQVARRRAAGLNPVSDAATAAPIGSSIGNASSGSAAGASAPSSDIAGSVMQGYQLSIQSRLATAQADKLAADADLASAEASRARGEDPVSKTVVDLNKSVSALNDATKRLTSSKIVSEGVSRRLMRFESKLRELDYKRLSSNTTIQTDHGSVTLPRFLADNIMFAAQAATQFEVKSRTRAEARNARLNTALLNNEVQNWTERFRATLDDIRAGIRRNESSSDAQDFENDINRMLRDNIIDTRIGEYNYKSGEYKRMNRGFNRGTRTVSEILNVLVPWSTTSSSNLH